MDHLQDIKGAKGKAPVLKSGCDWRIADHPGPKAWHEFVRDHCKITGFVGWGNGEDIHQLKGPFPAGYKKKEMEILLAELFKGVDDVTVYRKDLKDSAPPVLVPFEEEEE